MKHILPGQTLLMYSSIFEWIIKKKKKRKEN